MLKKPFTEREKKTQRETCLKLRKQISSYKLELVVAKSGVRSWREWRRSNQRQKSED
jgi:hypothetical protein